MSLSARTMDNRKNRMRLSYKLTAGAFLLAILTADFVCAEIPAAKKGKPKPQVEGQVLSALSPSATAGPASDERNELSDRLLDASGLKKQWRAMTAGSVVDKVQLGFMGVPREEIAIIDSVYTATFNSENHYQDLLGAFRRGMNKADLTGAMKWFQSPAGRKVVQLEGASQSMDIGQKSTAMASLAQSETPSKKRLGIVKRLGKGMDLANLLVGTVQSQIQPFLPLDSEFDGKPIEALLLDLKGTVWVQPSMFRILLSLLYTYKPLSDEELESFADFVESPHGAWFFQLKNKALSDAQVRLNEGVSEQVAMFKQALKSGEGKQAIRQILPPGTRYLFAQSRDPFLPLSRLKAEMGKIEISRLLAQQEEEERKLEAKKGPVAKAEKMPRFGKELKALRTIPQEIYNSLKRSNEAMYRELEHYAFLFRDKKELTAAEDKVYLDAVANYKELIDKTNRMQGEIILPSPLQAAYDSLRATGVLWNGKEPMALLETADNLGYTVRKGSLIGPAYGVVEAIDQNKIVVVERERDYMGKTLSKTKAIEFVQSNKNEGKP